VVLQPPELLPEELLPEELLPDPELLPEPEPPPEPELLPEELLPEELLPPPEPEALPLPEPVPLLPPGEFAAPSSPPSAVSLMWIGQAIWVPQRSARRAARLIVLPANDRSLITIPSSSARSSAIRNRRSFEATARPHANSSQEWCKSSPTLRT
jgi:hypothetical protein